MSQNDFGEIIRQHINIFETIDKKDIDNFVAALTNLSRFRRIIGLGAGRMGYSLQSFIMRLSHLGFNAFMLGDTTLPRVKDGDLIIVNSSSGNTPSIVLYAKQAREAGAVIILLTASKNSQLSIIADCTIRYSVPHNNQIMKTIYEQFSFLFFDYIIHRLVDDNKMDTKVIELNHSILE